jgi:hypothetical protein
MHDHTAPFADCGGQNRRKEADDFKINGDDAGDGLIGVDQDLPVRFSPDQADGQPAAQLAAGGLVPDPAVQPGPQDMQLHFGHGALHPQLSDPGPLLRRKWPGQVVDDASSTWCRRGRRAEAAPVTRVACQGR